MARILIIDDEENIRTSLRSALNRRGHDVVTAATLEEGTGFVRTGFDVILLDVLLPDGSGLDLMKSLLEQNKKQTIIMISGHADVDMAVEAIRTGAYDFIEKPLSLDRLLITVDNAIRTSNLLIQNSQLTNSLYGEMIGRSEAIVALKANVRKSAPLTTRFLILGENGTGKELVAHMIHGHSRFADGPFVSVNCAALPSELIEAELFGHSAGAFTGASKARKGKFVEADRGSIFLDEISEMPLSAQAKILRLVETKTVNPVGSDKDQTIDCNIIAASNRDLNDMVREDKFRQDLLYRLNVVQYNLPPLRKRVEDIPLLAEHFLSRFSDETKTGRKQLTEEAKTFLTRCDFPGNVRELKNLMERVNIYCDQAEIGPTDLRKHLPQTGPEPGYQSLKEAVTEYEIGFIKAAVARNGGNVSAAARELGLERSHLYKKLKKR
ncbi:MAG: sigma-54 dependent transcriptional regulator [bacterium]|nr:sigma-54 dependent transcriptional regulator [bacterium]